MNNHLELVDHEAKKISDRTRTECSQELDLLRRSLDFYGEGLLTIPPASLGEALTVSLALLSQNLNTLHVSIDSVTKGFYIQSLIPLRHVFEYASREE